MKLFLLFLISLFIFAGCTEETASETSSTSSSSGSSGSTDTDSSSDPITGGSWYQPSVSVTWQWQLQGTLNTDYDVEIYDIDLFDTSAATIASLQTQGRKILCYFSAGSYENWRSDAGQFETADLGNNLDGWPGEKWLDIRSSNVRQIMKDRLDLALEKGCDGVEPDNMDVYTQDSGFVLTAGDQLEYNRLIASEAHNRVLSVGLKNDLDQVSELLDYYDFSVNEQCHFYKECNLLAPFINAGKPVLNAEYNSYANDSDARAQMCSDSIQASLSTLVLSQELDDSIRFSCL